MSDSPIALEHPTTELRHHFADMDQQRDAASFGMWLFLGTEVMFFGGMFCAYLIYRYWYYNEFAIGSRSIDFWLGTINTAVLICSSLTVALGFAPRRWADASCWSFFCCSLWFLDWHFSGLRDSSGMKYKEHHIPGSSFNVDKLVHDYPQVHIDPAHEQIYFSLYFALTGLHALHMVIGLGIFIVLTYYAWKGKYTPEYHTPIEIGGLYWHFVDIVWIYLFPLLYLIDRKPIH